MYYKISQQNHTDSTASVLRNRPRKRWDTLRKCPFRIFKPHDVHPDFDNDWTISNDAKKEMKLRHMRNLMIKESLVKGVGVQYQSSGNSLWPRVKSGDCCFFEPILAPQLLKVGDIVFCEVQPKGRFFAHLILRMEEDGAAASARNRRIWTIGNIKGRENGWCYDRHIYGRMVEVVKTNSSIE